MLKLLSFAIALSSSLVVMSQTEYDEKILGTWKGTISGGGLTEKALTVVITSSNLEEGNCEGYSLVNNAGKTTFIGNLTVEADMPIVDASEPTTSKKNGEFHLEFGCFTDNGIVSDLCCGTWISYDKTISRNIELWKEE